jgi:lipid-binding SYLF domain-containing protein
VLIVPRLVKGGFIFGAEGGDGVLLKRNGRSWSQPAFFTLGSASFGLQIGIEQAELVFIIMSDRALSGIVHGETKLGAGAGLTVVTLSSGAEGATTTHGGDIVVWASGTGAYGGLTFNGSVVKPRNDWNADFYGKDVSIMGVLTNKVTSRETAGLRANLAHVW